MQSWTIFLLVLVLILSSIILRKSEENVSTKKDSMNEEIIDNQQQCNNFPISRFRNNKILHHLRNSKYSSHFCLGGLQLEAWNIKRTWNPVVWQKTQCIFQNVVLNSEGELIYYQNPLNLPVFDYIQGTREPIVTLPSSFFDGRIKINFVNGSYEDLFHGKRIQMDEDVSFVFGFPSCEDMPNTPGHDYDHMWTTYLSMSALSMLSLKNVIILKDRSQNRACSKLSKVWQMLGNEQMKFEDLLKEKNGILLTSIVYPQSEPDFDNTLPTIRFGETTEFIERTKEIFQIPVSIANSQPKIGIRLKKKRHRFLNHNDIIKQLSQVFPKSQVLEFTPEIYSVKEEIEFISSLDVYITPGGGGSFSSIFLSPGASAIYGSVCFKHRPYEKRFSDGTFEYDPVNGTILTCYRSDAYVFDVFPNFFKFTVGAYKMEDLKFEGDNIDKVPTRRRETHIFSWSYNVSMAPLIALVERALYNRGFKKEMLE